MIDLGSLSADHEHPGPPRREWVAPVVLVVLFMICLVLFGVFVDPSAGAAGGCGGG